MEHAPYVVAIAGGTCSGKSTLCDRLENTFAPLCPTLALHMDSYYKKETPTTVAPITRKVYAEHNTPRPWSWSASTPTLPRPAPLAPATAWCWWRGCSPCTWRPSGSGRT